MQSGGDTETVHTETGHTETAHTDSAHRQRTETAHRDSAHRQSDTVWKEGQTIGIDLQALLEQMLKTYSSTQLV